MVPGVWIGMAVGEELARVPWQIRLGRSAAGQPYGLHWMDGWMDVMQASVLRSVTVMSLTPIAQNQGLEVFLHG